ncbi:hypothetical protein [Persephonella sp.]
MKKLITAVVVLSIFSFACGTAGKKTETSQQKNPPVKQEVKIKKECKDYVSRMENCLKSAEGKDYRKLWSTCEGQVMWDMLKEYQDNGFCFDEDECKQKVLEEINNCKEERTYLFRKYYR